MSPGQTLLHRDHELGAIQEALSGVRAGRPSVLLIQGSRGIGKTTLVNAALAARPDVGAVLLARGHPTERDHPFGVVRQLFEPLMAAGRAPPAGLADGFDPKSDQSVAPDLLRSLYRTTRSITGDRPLLIAISSPPSGAPTSPGGSTGCR